MHASFYLLAAQLLLAGSRSPPAAAAAASGPKTERCRWAAFDAMQVACKEGKAGQPRLDRAAELYTQMTGEPAPQKWKAFAERWYKRGVAGKPMTAPPGGRQPFMSNKLVKTIAEEWTQKGVGTGQKWRPYLSMEEVRREGRTGHACSRAAAAAAPRCAGSLPPHLEPQLYCFLQAMREHPQLRKLVEKTHVTAKHLIRRCKEVVPQWRLSTMPEKRGFSPPEKKARLAYSTEAVQRPMDYWKSTIFVDEHTFYAKVKPLRGIWMGGRRWRRKSFDKRCRGKGYSWPKLHFLYGVHWAIGVIGPYWISDCTKWKSAIHYPRKVSSPPVPS